MKKSQWKDGRKFARRVHVHSATQLGSIYHTHAEDALRMCLEGTAEPMIEKGSSRISGIILLFIPGEYNRRPGVINSSARDYSGQRYVFKERLGEKDAFEGHVCYTFDKNKI